MFISCSWHYHAACRALLLISLLKLYYVLQYTRTCTYATTLACTVYTLGEKSYMYMYTSLYNLFFKHMYIYMYNVDVHVHCMYSTCIIHVHVRECCCVVHAVGSWIVHVHVCVHVLIMIDYLLVRRETNYYNKLVHVHFVNVIHVHVNVIHVHVVTHVVWLHY